jgi:hypothetical protein
VIPRVDDDQPSLRRIGSEQLTRASSRQVAVSGGLDDDHTPWRDL